MADRADTAVPPAARSAVEAQLAGEATLYLGRTRNGGVVALTDERLLLVGGRRWRRLVSVPYDTVDWVVERVGFEVFADKVRRRLVFAVADADRERVRTLLAERVTLTEPTTYLGQALRDWFRR